MYATTAAFQAAWVKSHTAAFKAEVLVNGAVVATINNVIGGSVDVDSTAQVLRSGEVKFVDRTGALIPLTASSNLAPYGNELRVWRGITYPSGTTEWVPVITGGIMDTDVEEVPGQGVVITCEIYDRSRLVTLSKFTDVYNVAKATNVATAINNILRAQMPAALYNSMTINFGTTTETTPNLILGDSADNDPWKNCQDLATAVGFWLYFDPLGNPTLASVPDPLSQNPVVTVAEGSNLLKVKRRITAEATYNGVVATGENTSSTTPYRATAWDTSTNSPTYYLGKFGKRPRYYSSPFINSANAATNAANAILLTTLGGTELVSFGTLVNPAFAPLDVALLTRTSLGVNTRYVLESFNVPLEVGSGMDAVCRARRTV